MKELKVTACLILVFLILCSAFFVFLHKDKPKFETLEERADFPFGVLYNGTRYKLLDFQPIIISDQKMISSLNFDIMLENYAGKLIVSQEGQEDFGFSEVFEVARKKEGNGIYKIRNLRVEPEGNIKKYPYEEYKCNITFKSENETYPKIFNYYVKDNTSSLRWYIDAYGEGNKLFFRFYRTLEQRTYEILEFTGLFCLYFNLVALFFLLWTSLEKNIKNNTILDAGKISGTAFFYLGNIVGIPFYAGVIINYIMNMPIFGDFMYSLIVIVIISLISGATTFVFREYTKKQRMS